MTISLPSRVEAYPLAKNRRVLDEPNGPRRKRIGSRLKALRVEQGLHQVDVARRAKISTGTLQTIEWGARANHEANIDKVARVLGTSLAALEQTPHLDPADPRLKGLNREDIDIARAYHEASTVVRQLAKQLLQEQDPQALPAPTSAEAAARAARIAKLNPTQRQFIDGLIQQFESSDQRDEGTG